MARVRSWHLLLAMPVLSCLGLSYGQSDSVKDKKESTKVGTSFTNVVGMKIVRIPGTREQYPKKGTFTMGSPKSEKGRSDDEEQHEVEVSEFYLGEKEVTQKQYQDIMGKTPTFFSASGCGKDEVKGMDTNGFPVEQVSWEDAKQFCEELNRKSDSKRPVGWVYRLPREAEWEYACRGGASTYQVFHFGDILNDRKTQANFDGNYSYESATNSGYLEGPCEVGSYKANGFGLFDMHGSVGEWCADRYASDYYGNRAGAKDPAGPAVGSYRVIRGGSWYSDGGYCRSAIRHRFVPEVRVRHWGFRVALVPFSRGKME